MLAPAKTRLRLAPSPKARRDWTDELRGAVTSLADLERHFELTEEERSGALRAEQAGLPISITPYYLALADRRDPSCPIRRQCVPQLDETREVPGDLVDPLGEKAHEVAPDLVSRYPDRALLLVSDRCSVYCRFCTRSRMVGAGGGARSLEHLAPAFAWLAEHPEIRDVIVSGGDPLMMSTSAWCSSSRDFARSERRDDSARHARAGDLAVAHHPRARARASPFHPVWVMTHFNHPKELTPQRCKACAGWWTRAFR